MAGLTWIIRSRKFGQRYEFFTAASSKTEAEHIFRASHPAWPILSVERQVSNAPSRRLGQAGNRPRAIPLAA